MLPIKILPAAKLPLGARKIKRGAYGADVKELQELMAQRGFFPAEPNGNFGYVTDEAVREFQAAHRLRCDGIVGPKVIDALLGTAHAQAHVQAHAQAHVQAHAQAHACVHENAHEQARTDTRTHAPTHDLGEVYVVTHEKNLSEVAAKLAIPVGTLASSNQTSVSAALYPGQRLKINRRILGAWLEKCGARACLRKDFPVLSLLVYPAATIDAGGSLVQVNSIPTLGVGDAGIIRPAFAAAFTTQDAALWRRFLKRRDWWKTWAVSCLEVKRIADMASEFTLTSVPAFSSAAIAFETITPRQSERRRILRFLRFLSSSRSKDGQLGNNHVVFSCILSGAKPAVPIDWLQQLIKHCDYIILWFDPTLAAEKMRGVLRRILKKVHAGKMLLGVDLAARETVFSDDDNSITAQNRLGYFEAQARAAGAMRLTKDRGTVPLSRKDRGTVPLSSTRPRPPSPRPAPLCQSFRYRLKGQWRTLELLDYQAVITLCSLADEMGLAGTVLRGLEQGDARLFRVLSQTYALADPGWGWERQ